MRRTTLNRRITLLGAEVWRAVASRRLAIVVLAAALAVSVAGVVASSRLTEAARVPGYYGVAPLLAMPWGEGASPGSRLAGVGLGAIAALSLVRLLQAWVVGWGATVPRGAQVRLHEVPWGVEETWREVGAALAATGLRLESASARGDARLGLARRSGLAGRLSGAFYLGVLLLLAASLVAQGWGWAGEPVELALGETRAFGEHGEVTARLEQIEITPTSDDGIPSLASTLRLSREGNVAGDVRVNTLRRASAAGLALYQLGYGPAARVAARGTDGAALRLQSMAQDPEPRTVARISFSGRQQEHLLALPEANMVVRMVHYPSLEARGIAGPVLHVRVERGIDGLSLADEFLTEGRQLRINGITLDIDFEYYVVVRAAREPHLPIAALGATMVLLGMIGFVAWPDRRVWVAVRAREGAETLCQFAVEPREASAGWLAGVEAVLVERACGRRDGGGN